MKQLYEIFFIKKKTKIMYFIDVIEMFQIAELGMLPETIA